MENAVNALRTIGMPANFPGAILPLPGKKRMIEALKRLHGTTGFNRNCHPNQRFFWDSKEYGYLFYALLLLNFAAAHAGTFNDDERDNNVNWQEAARFVDTLQFKKAFIDSVKGTFNVVFPASPLRTVAEQSFARGEILVYDIGWGPFKAGYVVLTAEPDDATRTIRLDGKALSRGIVTTFYRMRDNVISTVDADGLYPLFFEQHLREGKHFKADTWILFDHLRDSTYIKDGKLLAMSSSKFTNDYLSIFYYLRSRTFGPGDTFSLPICVDKRLRTINFFCKCRDTVDLDGKGIACLDILPRISDDKGAFNKKNGFEVWLSDDVIKMPIKIKSKIRLGSINAKLIYAFRPTCQTVQTTVRRHDSAPSSDTATPQLVRKHDSSKSAEMLKVPDSTGQTGAFQSPYAARVHDIAPDPRFGRDSSSP
jgi:hypothetical protein